MAVSATGSALDVASLVTQLVAAERAPHNLRLARIESGAKAKLSALATITAALDGLKRALSPLKSADAFAARSVKSSSDTALAATAAAGTAAGRYEVEVLALASAHKLVSAPFADGTTFGAGTLQVEVGSDSINVTVQAGQTLAEVRAAIAAAASAAGLPLQATGVTSDGGQHLVLSAATGGSDQAIRVTRTGDASLDALVFDPGTLTSLAERQPASNAQVRIDGQLVSSATNTVTGAVAGLALTLKTAAPGTVHTVDVGRDNAPTRKAVESMVAAYNAVVASVGMHTKYDPTTREAAALNGDGLVRSTAAQLRGALGDALASAASAGLAASELGIATRVDGTLSFDGAKFESAMASAPDAVREAFAGSTGLATRLDALLATATGAGSGLAGRTEGLNARLREVADQRAALDVRMASVEARYRAQYTALDSLMAQLQSTSSFIASQLG